MEQPICVDGNDELENDVKISMGCKYCKIKEVFANSPVLQHLSHERGCKRNTKADLKQTLNNPNQEHNCHVCESTFSELKQLKQHVEDVHEGKKKFQCEICEKCFKQKVGSDKHLKLDS